MSAKIVREIQRLYPQIYIGCHVDHVRSASTKWRLSSRDSSILAHLNEERGTGPRELAAHLQVAPSTLSAAIRRLTELGYISSNPSQCDLRQRELRLTAQGAEAMVETSVLDAGRVGSMLRLLAPKDLKAALSGLRLLANAARQLRARK